MTEVSTIDVRALSRGFCIGRIAMRPTQSIFGRIQETMVTYEVECPGGAFGVMRVPVPVEAEKQGRTHKFDIAAGVQYPDGRGETLWYRDGLFIRSSLSFEHPLMTAITAVAAASGSLLIVKPASIQIDFPDQVAMELPEEASARTKVLWTPSDPELPENYDFTIA